MKISSFTNLAEKSVNTMEFPWVGIGKNATVVAFSERYQGTVINRLNSNYPFGSYRTDWKMEEFKPFIGELKIVCTND